MADVKWIKITTEIFDDEKMLLIESLPSADSIIVIWFKLLILAGKQNNDGVFIMNDRIAYTDEMLASVFRRDVNTVRLALTTFEKYGMIDVIDNVVTIPNWNKHQTLDAYERKKARDRLYQAERRANQRALVQKSSDTSFDVAVSEEEKEEEKEIDIDKESKRYKRKPKKEDTHTLFDRIISDYAISDFVKAKVSEWIDYKIGRKDDYQEQGLKALLRRIENAARDHGDDAIVDLIDECMSNNWKGIIFDRLKQKSNQPTSNYVKQSKADELNDFYRMAKEWSESE